MPSHDVKGGVILFRSEQMPIELGQQRPIGLRILLERSDGGLEIARVGQTVRTDWTELGELEVALI